MSISAEEMERLKRIAEIKGALWEAIHQFPGGMNPVDLAVALNEVESRVLRMVEYPGDPLNIRWLNPSAK